MAKVTSKLQITIPKVIAEQYGIEPGDEIDFRPAGAAIRLVPPKGATAARLTLEERLRLFDEATARQREREKQMRLPAKPQTEKDWTREDLYTRGSSD
ncbi:MAG: AbrB/MazE/SpoVT family DNA-binding domain-containing protein [Xanthomonadales bacterium]|nr:AbrB/MazE/SpoVT family DNA-binding domain-containing protein [Xanthomonadales bacterium]